MRPPEASDGTRFEGPTRIPHGRAIVAVVVFLALLVPPLSAYPAWAAAGPSTAPGPPARAVHLAVRTSIPALPTIGAERRLIVSPTDPTVVPNDGLRTNITAPLYAPAAADASFQIAVEEVIGGYEALFGIFDNYALGPVPFFDVFTNQSVHSVHLAYGTTPVSGGVAYEFDLRSSGGTSWTLRLNGALLGGTANTSSFDFGSASATWAGGVGFSEVAIFANLTPVPAILTTTVLFAFHQSAGWYLPSGAQTMIAGQGVGAWGIEGRNQHGTLAPGEVRSGTAIALVPNGTPLWNGGPVPVQVGLTLSATSTVATLPVRASITVRELGGRPLPGVPVDLSDALSGQLLLASSPTDPNGSLSVPFVTPNVSQPSHDLVRATVTILGYLGTTGVGLDLAPPAQLSVSFSGGSPTVELNATTILSFRATDAVGRGAPGILVEFTATAGGTVALGAVRAGTDGVASIAFTGGAVPTTVVVEAVVAEPGFWGHAAVLVHVVTPTPSLLDRLGPGIFYGIVGGVVAVLAVLLTYRWRHRPQIPELRLSGSAPSGPTAPGERMPGHEPGEGPLSRTPP